MLRLNVKQWFLRRFVVISELLGYMISAAVGIGVLYSLFQQVEIIARGTGELHPVFIDIAADSNVLLIDYIAVNGQKVRQGEPVLRLASDRAAQRRILSKRNLEDAIAVLEIESADAKALENARNALDSLPSEEKGEIITAPSSGIFCQLAELKNKDILPAGTPLALLYDMSQLEFIGPLGNSLADGKVIEGQPARITVPELHETLTGYVDAVETADSGKKIILRFGNIADSIHDYFLDLVNDNKKGASITANAEIVVGRQSLFKQTFGRRQ